MITLKSAFMVPAVVSGLWVARGEPVGNDAAFLYETSHETQTVALQPVHAPKEVKTVEEVAQEQEDYNFDDEMTIAHDEVMSRRVRVERLLVTLDRIAEVSLQMGPEQAAWIEPVLVDLAEQTLELSSEEAVNDRSTDSSLGELEGTVEKLVSAVSRIVEPEIEL